MLPISITWPLNVLFGDRVDGDVGRLVELDVDDIGLIHLDFGGDQRHVGDGHDEACGRVLNARHHGFADAHRQIGHHAVERADRVVLLQNVVEAGQGGVHLRDAPLRTIELRRRLFALRLHLRQPGFRLRAGPPPGNRSSPSWCRIPVWAISFSSSICLRAIEVQTRALEIGLRAVDGSGRGEQVLVHGFDTGLGGGRVGLGRIQGRVLRCTSASGWTDSSFASICPLPTWSPSLTMMSVIRPMTLAPILK